MMMYYPRGICCHEAGHAVVAWSFGLTVAAVYVAHSKKKGWYGGTDYVGPTDARPLIEQVTGCAAGYTAERVFDCPAHKDAARGDFGQIALLLTACGIPEQEHWARIAEANIRAETILKSQSDNFQKLTRWLADSGRIDRPKFERLMGDKAQ